MIDRPAIHVQPHTDHGTPSMKAKAPVICVLITKSSLQDGKWKVDTSYIGYRTENPDNLTRKEEKVDDAVYVPRIMIQEDSRRKPV